MTTRQMHSEAHKLVMTLYKAQRQMNYLGEEIPFYLLKDFIGSLDAMISYIDQRVEVSQ